MPLEKSTVTIAPKKVAGVTTKTHFQNECDPQSSKIGPLVGHYFQSNIPETITHRTMPNTAILGYTQYDTAFQNPESANYTGPYTFFIGEEVASFENSSPNLVHLEIPGGTYVKFTTPPGLMPFVVLQAWQEIWKMTNADLGGRRTFLTDFQVHDHRAQNSEAAIVDIYIGITMSS